MPIKLTELVDAFQFVSAGGLGECQAFLDRRTGQFHYRPDDTDDTEDKLPDGIGSDHYLEVPHKSELGLGKRVALDFADEVLPQDVNEVRDIFSRSGAFGRFKSFLQRRGALDRWYAFSDQAEEAALRDWCEECGLEVEAG